MPPKIFVDTSGFFAFLNKADTHHEEGREKFQSGKRITSNYVFDELMTLLAARGQKDLSITFGEELRASHQVTYHFLTSSEEEKAWQLYKKFRDHPLSFTDCTTLVLLRDYRIPGLLSFDQSLLNLAKSF